MILVDTSVWIDHLQKRSTTLMALLERGEVLAHPFVIGELACGSMKHRSDVLASLAELPSATVASDEETLFLIEEHALSGKGIGYIDAHLLASVRLTAGAALWTRDKRLAALASALHRAVPYADSMT